MKKTLLVIRLCFLVLCVLGSWLLCYTIPEWVDAPGVGYVTVDGELELLPGIRLLPAPGHTAGSQVVVVEAAGDPVVICGDTAVFSAELDDPSTEGQRLIRALGPAEVWLSHEHRPWRPAPHTE